MDNAKNKLNILIVEDELIIAEDMNTMLSKMGYHVMDIALDAQEAIQFLEAHKPDLILLDIRLGGKKDGIELAEEINEKYSIPFIFTTSFGDGETIERAKKVKPINYLIKPFKPEQLFTSIEIAMDKLAENQVQPGSVSENHEDGLVIQDALFIKDKFSYTKILLEDILWIKAEGNYIKLHTANKKALIRSGITSFIERANNPLFFRTHKSYAINLKYLNKVSPNSVEILQEQIPLSKGFSDELIKKLRIL